MTRPTYQRSTAWKTEPATATQYELISSIVAERTVPDAMLAEYGRQYAAADTFTKEQASAWATVLKGTPPAALDTGDAIDPPASGPGIYDLDGIRYRVTRNVRTGRLNAFDGGTGEYARGVIARLRESHRATTEGRTVVRGNAPAPAPAPAQRLYRSADCEYCQRYSRACGRDHFPDPAVIAPAAAPQDRTAQRDDLLEWFTAPND